MTAHIAYRGDIEGLRGIAVLFVLAFHLDLALTGGFIGVDIFYVISGFLIASIIQRGVTLQTSSIAEFYARRLKRLMPAFLFMLAWTSAACLLLMLPDDLLAFWKSARESLLFRSNRFFAREVAGYFAPDASALPLLHTWSLSIEWQYYLVFPAGLLLLQRWASQRVRLGVLLALAAVLVVLSAIETQSPHDAYFSASARAFEFVMGAALALAPAVRTIPLRANVFVAASLAGLVAMAFSFSPRTSFPGMNAFVVCVLAATAIRYGEGSTLLSGRWSVYLGKRSYSIYLWHWPIVAMAGYVGLRDVSTTYVNVLLAAPILAVAELSYRLVERPALRARMGFSKSIGLLLVAPLAITLATLPVLRHYDGWPGRLGPDAERVFVTLKSAARDRERCNDLDLRADIEQCALGDLAATDRALLIGDSHAQHYWALVDVLAKQAHLKVNGLTNGECLALDGARLVRHGVPNDTCTNATRLHYQMIAQRSFKFVIIGERWIGYPESELQLLHPSIEAIVNSGARPVILKPVAEDGRNPSNCFFRHVKLRQPYADDCAIAPDNPFAREKKQYVEALITRASQHWPQLVVIDIQRVQCDAAGCATVVDGVPIYSDLHHLNDYGAETLANRLLRATGNPLSAASALSAP